MQNISNTLKLFVRQLAVNAAAATTPPESLKLADQAGWLVRMIDETNRRICWKMTHGKRSNAVLPSDLIDEVVPEVLRPPLSVKGCNCRLITILAATMNAKRSRRPLRRILLLLIQYAVTTTAMANYA